MDHSRMKRDDVRPKSRLLLKVALPYGNNASDEKGRKLVFSIWKHDYNERYRLCGVRREPPAFEGVQYLPLMEMLMVRI
jgi:hypothetical protein